MNTRQTQQDFLSTVKKILLSIGYSDKTELDSSSWAQLYNEGHSPLSAVLSSEFDYEGSPAAGWLKYISKAIKTTVK